MESVIEVRSPKWYWVVSWLALIWMLFGAAAWVMDLMTDEAALAQMSPAQREFYEARPQWLFVVYAIAIFSGLAGAIGLLLRKAWAVTAFAVSLVAVVIQFGYLFLGMRMIERVGAAEAVPFSLVIFCIGALLLWFAAHAKKRGWLTS